MDNLISFIRDYYGTSDPIPLHAPVFNDRELGYVTSAVKSTFVSSVGEYVNRFERDIEKYTGTQKAVATVTGTAALHIALKLAGVVEGDLVLTQPLTFVATCNAVKYCGAEPVFVDVDMHTMGLSPSAVEAWLVENTFIDDEGDCRTNADNRVVRACLPMHTFGHPVDLNELVVVCKRWQLSMVEDAAESLGSLYHDQHTGTFGELGILSFNGNKIITSGGGGMILTGKELGVKAKHLTTTAKQPHAYEFIHDSVAYNYRLPNLNAALGCAQLEQLDMFVNSKRKLAEHYRNHLKGTDWMFFDEPSGCRSNYWLNALICANAVERDAFLKETNQRDVMTRPIWSLMNKLPMYEHCLKGELINAEWLEARVVNVPSGVVDNQMKS